MTNNDEKVEFEHFKYAVMARLNEFGQHWNQMNMLDEYQFNKYNTFEKWFDEVLNYVSQNVNKH